jgi:glucokinase
MILAADIGGTKLLFGLFETKGAQPALMFKQRYFSRDFTSLEQATKAFLKGLPEEFSAEEIRVACFSVAGPVSDGNCQMTNLGWEVSTPNLKKTFPNIEAILVRNDMEAMGKGLSLIDRKDIVTLMPAGTMEADFFNMKQIDQTADTKNVVGFLAPGTGLGEAYMIGDRVMPSEGGHCDFGPRDRLQAELWNFLRRETGHVSYERILSGEGFCRLVRFLMDEKGIDQVDFPLIPEEITKRAQVGSDHICTSAVQLFANVLGAEAGNLALKTMATSGIVLGGNIVKEILPWLQGSGFAEGFLDKGRFSNLMKTIPVYGVLDSDGVLYGSAVMALEMER